MTPWRYSVVSYRSMITGINSEDTLVQAAFARHLEEKLGWESIYAWNQETFGLAGTLGRTDTREVVLTRELRNALYRLNRHLAPEAIKDAVAQLTQHDFSRLLLQHNRDFYRLIRDGVPVSYRDARGQMHTERARVIDFQNGYSGDGDNDKKADREVRPTERGVPNNRFLAVRELKITGLRSTAYNRRADLVCFRSEITIRRQTGRSAPLKEGFPTTGFWRCAN